MLGQLYNRMHILEPILYDGNFIPSQKHEITLTCQTKLYIQAAEGRSTRLLVIWNKKVANVLLRLVVVTRLIEVHATDPAVLVEKDDSVVILAYEGLNLLLYTSKLSKRGDAGCVGVKG
jgi:hypothetical protein